MTHTNIIPTIVHTLIYTLHTHYIYSYMNATRVCTLIDKNLCMDWIPYVVAGHIIVLTRAIATMTPKKKCIHTRYVFSVCFACICVWVCVQTLQIILYSRNSQISHCWADYKRIFRLNIFGCVRDGRSCAWVFFKSMWCAQDRDRHRAVSNLDWFLIAAPPTIMDKRRQTNSEKNGA